MSTRSIPYVLKPDYISVIVQGKPFALDNSHPTFARMKKAIETKDWARVPKLVNLAQQIANESRGNITVTKKGVAYKGRIIHTTLAHKILEMINHRKPVAPMLKFMDNLYRNPDEQSRLEFYEWLNKGGVSTSIEPSKMANWTITDDGCFLAYKVVDKDFKDCYTHTIDNRVGQVVLMKRKDVDPDRRNECSRGLHFCSLGYVSHFGGGHIMIIKINPKDVVAIPQDYGYTKGRCWRYEVIEEHGAYQSHSTVEAAIMKQVVVPIAKERQVLLKQLLAIPSVQRAIRRGKIKKSTIVKQTYGRLVKLYQRYADAKLVATAPDQSKVLTANPLREVREAAGISRSQVAEELDISTKQVWAMEKAANPKSETIDRYLEAVAVLTKLGSTCRTALAYPNATSIPRSAEYAQEQAAVATAAPAQPSNSPAFSQEQFDDHGNFVSGGYDELYDDDDDYGDDDGEV